LIVIALWSSPYNNTWAQEQIYIVHDTGRLIKATTNSAEICNARTDITYKQFLEEMREQGELMTSNEFASRITSYYDILVAVLGTMFGLFTIATYLSFKQMFETKFEQKEKDIEKKQQEIEDRLRENIRKNLQEMLRDSRSVRDDIVNAVAGNIDGQFATREEFDLLNNYTQNISEKQQDIMTQLASLQELCPSQLTVVDDSLEDRKNKEA
ncbi:hypothetical protein, partial [Porphyromonas loveana]